MGPSSGPRREACLEAEEAIDPPVTGRHGSQRATGRSAARGERPAWKPKGDRPAGDRPGLEAKERSTHAVTGAALEAEGRSAHAGDRPAWKPKGDGHSQPAARSPPGSRKAIRPPGDQTGVETKGRSADRATGRPGSQRAIGPRVTDRRGSRRPTPHDRRRPAIAALEPVVQTGRAAARRAATGVATARAETRRHGQVDRRLRLRRRHARGVPANCRRLTASGRRAMTSVADEATVARP